MVVDGGGAVDVGARVVVVVGVVVVVEGVVVEDVGGVVVDDVEGVVVEVEVVDDVGEGDGEPPLRADSTSAVREPTT